jgi:hypothetical protein
MRRPLEQGAWELEPHFLPPPSVLVIGQSPCPRVGSLSLSLPQPPSLTGASFFTVPLKQPVIQLCVKNCGNALDYERSKEGDYIMKTITQALLALGFVGAMAIGTSVSTKAQSIGFYGPGVGVEIITRRYNHRHPRYNRYYDNQPYAYQYSRGYDGRYRTWNGCPPNYTIQDGQCKPYRGY